MLETTPSCLAASATAPSYTVRATEDFERLLTLQPHSFAAHMALADAWAASGDSERAIARFTQMLTQRRHTLQQARLPNAVRAMLLVRRANAFAHKKEHAMAIKDYSFALQIDSSACVWPGILPLLFSHRFLREIEVFVRFSCSHQCSAF